MFVFSPATPVQKAIGPGARWVARLATPINGQVVGPLVEKLLANQGRIPASKLAQSILAGNESDVLELSRVGRVGGIVASFKQPTRLGLRLGGELAVKDLGGAGVALDMGRPRIAGWLEEHAAELVREVNGTSREAVRSILNDGVLRGVHPRKLAQEIQHVVGLTEPHAIAVARRRQAMVAAGLPDARVEALSNRYAERLLKHRAEVIAKHETMTAINRGRYELWAQLDEEGALEPGVQREWLTSADEAVCKICGPANGQKVGMRESYELGGGRSVAHPPAHVGCRCTEALT